MRSVVTVLLNTDTVNTKVADPGSKQVEQEEKENNDHETSRKRPGHDADGERGFFIQHYTL